MLSKKVSKNAGANEMLVLTKRAEPYGEDYTPMSYAAAESQYTSAAVNILATDAISAVVIDGEEVQLPTPIVLTNVDAFKSWFYEYIQERSGYIFDSVERFFGGVEIKWDGQTLTAQFLGEANISKLVFSNGQSIDLVQSETVASALPIIVEITAADDLVLTAPDGTETIHTLAGAILPGTSAIDASSVVRDEIKTTPVLTEVVDWRAFAFQAKKANGTFTFQTYIKKGYKLSFRSNGTLTAFVEDNRPYKNIIL